VGLQTRELRQFADARCWTVAGEYIDAGVSGAKELQAEAEPIDGRRPQKALRRGLRVAVR